MSSVPQADGYSDGLACEHEYMVGPPCAEPAAWVLRGVARCADHFTRFIDSHAWTHQADLRHEARRAP